MEFVLPYLTVDSRGPAPKLSFHALFNYILKLLYLGCQCKELPIEKDEEGRPEIHHTGIYRAFRRWEADGCLDAIFEGTVLKLRDAGLLDVSVIHGDGTTTAAKKGGDNIGFSGHKRVKGDKVVAFCDRNCNVIAPFISAPVHHALILEMNVQSYRQKAATTRKTRATIKSVNQKAAAQVAEQPLATQIPLASDNLARQSSPQAQPNHHPD